jgi:alanine racemase
LKKTVLEIDLNALEHNFNIISSKLKPSTKFMAVIKAGGYGSDSVEIAKKLESIGVDYFAVAFTSEGIDLRKAGIKTPILVLLPQVESIKNIIDYNLQASLYSFYFLENFIDYVNEKEVMKCFCHFKINTGLNRVGFSDYQIDDAIEKIKNCKPIKLAGIYSHLAATDDLNETKFTNSQINLFKKLSSKIKSQISYDPILHMSNTSGIFNYPECEFDMVRSGIGLYGYNNYLNQELVPVHSLKSVIAQIINCNKGESVGYNRSFFCKNDMKVGVIPIGHADGISRLFSKNAHIFISGIKAEVLGNICMDVLMINLNGINCDEGDEVVVFDSKNNAEDFAKFVGTISYEILTNLSSRIERKIIR